MAVYKRTYRAYSGALTPAWSRFLVLYRASRRTVFRSKFSTVFFVLCFFFPLLSLLGIYTNAHLSILSIVTKNSGPFLNVNNTFFFTFMTVQSTLAFIFTAFVGPGLVSPDLANGALTLYLCRPLSRAEYVLGKMSVLVITLSWITWVPGLVLFFAQAGVAGSDWLVNNLWIAGSIIASSLIWILVLSVLSLALSAWVKWRIVAGALLLAIFFVGAGFAQAVNAVLETTQGYVLDIGNLILTIQRNLFRETGSGAIPVNEAWIALLIFSGILLSLLFRRIRAIEVVK